MKRLWTVLCAAALSLTLCVPVCAAGSAELVRAFVSGGILYTYVDITGSDQPITKAEAKLDGRTFPASRQLETVRQAGSPITCLLLVDNSTSMPAFREEVAAFADTLAQNAGKNTRFILATFGSDFQVAAEGLVPAELAGQIDGLTYGETVTRLHSGIAGALDYFEALPREGYELRSMVMLTDAVQYDPKGGVPYEELLDRVEQSDVLLHAVGFGEDQKALDSLSQLVQASGGVQWNVRTEDEAVAGAEAWKEYTDKLFVTGFDLSGYAGEGGSQPISVTFGSGGELVCRAEAKVQFPELEEGAGKPSVQPPDPKPAEPDPAPSAQQLAEEKEAQGPSGLGIAAAAAGALVVIVAAAVLFRGRKKPSAAAEATVPEAAAPLEEGIYLRLVVLRGELASGRTELTLVRELLIGSGLDCEIAFQDPGLPQRAARIYLDDGAVCLEDLCSGEFRVNGVPVQNIRVLRSGDEINVGIVSFQLKF